MANTNYGFPVQMTIADLFAVSKLIRNEFDRGRYYAEMSDEEVADIPAHTNEEGEEVAEKNNSYKRTEREKDRANRAELSALHQRITGESLL